MTAPIESVFRDDILYRRLLRFHIKPTGQISSAAFKDKKGRPDSEVSVDLARLTTPERCLFGLPGMRLGQIKASVPLDLGLSVEHRPVVENDAHCVIAGMHTIRTCRLLAEATTVLL